MQSIVMDESPESQNPQKEPHFI